jgi:hypothetical protein
VKTIASYGLAIVGTVMMLGVFARAIASNMKYVYGRTMLINLLRTAPNRAELVARQTKNTFYEPIGAAMAAAAMMQSRDAALIQKVTKPAYDANGMAVSMQWKGMLTKAKLALMAVGGGLAIGLSGGVPPILVMVASAVTGFAFLYLLVRKADIDRSIVLARAEILPEAERAIVDGRYVFPPPPA